MGSPLLPLHTDSIPSSLILEENATLFECYDSIQKPMTISLIFCVPPQQFFVSFQFFICSMYVPAMSIRFHSVCSIFSSPVPHPRMLSNLAPLRGLTIVPSRACRVVLVAIVLIVLDWWFSHRQ
jgi:hypothetical protein